MKKISWVLLSVTFVFISQVFFIGKISLAQTDSVNVGLQISSPGGVVVVGVPLNLNLEVKSDSEIKILWSDNSNNEEGFKVERKKEGESFVVIADLLSGTIGYTDSNLDPETKYIYRVRAYTGNVYSDYSSEIGATTDLPDIEIESAEGYCDYFTVTVLVDSYYKNKDLDFKIKFKNLETNNEEEESFQNKEVDNDGNVEIQISSLERNSRYEISASYRSDNSSDYSSWSDKKNVETAGCQDIPVVIETPISTPSSTPSPDLVEAPIAVTASPAVEYVPPVKPLNLISEEKKEKEGVVILEAPLKFLEEKIVAIQEIVQEKEAEMTTASLTSLGISALALASQLPSVGYLGVFIRGVWSFLSGIFVKRKKVWGLVFDNLTGKPISLAAVSIFNQDNRKMDSKLTDNFGAYSFLVSPGEYYLETQKNGYRFSPNVEGKIFYSNQYSGEKINMQQYDIVKEDIPMVQDETSFQKITQAFKVKKTLSYFFLIGGMVFSFGVLLLNQNLLNLIVCLIYLASVLISYAMTKGKKWGIIKNENNKPESFATIKIFEKENHKLKARTMTDEKGRYFLILDPGVYDVEIVSVGGVTKSQEISLENREALIKDMNI